MKKSIMLLLAVGCVIGLAGCSGNVGNVKNVQIGAFTSDIYSDAEIDSAIDVAVDYFQKQFDGCTLTEITYSGDGELENWKEFAGRHQMDEVIVLDSAFDVDSFGGDGSLNPNSTYTGWKWILGRTRNGEWKHLDHGY